MKKIVYLLLVLTLSLSLCACGSGTAKEESSAPDITVSSEAPTPAPETKVKLAKITADSLNIRAEASTDGEILAVAYADEYFELVKEEVSEGWNQIKYNGKDAYISSEFSSVTEITESEADSLLNPVQSEENTESSSDSSTESSEESSVSEASESSEESSGVTAETVRKNEDGEAR